MNGKRDLKLKAVIFDYGEVLCLPPRPEEIEASARILSISVDSFHNLWGRNRDLYDRGDLTPEVYWRRFAEDAGTSLGDAQLRELSEKDVLMWSQINPEMLAWIEALCAAGRKTAVLSNMHLGMVQHARQNFRWLQLLDCATFSAEVGLIKPDPAIYELCLRELGVSASDALFIDDRELNVAAARNLGINAFRYRTMAQLRSELAQAGFPNLPPDTSPQRTRSA